MKPALGPTQPPVQWVSGTLSLGIRQLGHEADSSPPFSTEVKNVWSYASTPVTSSWHGTQLNSGYIFMAWCLVKHRNSTFTLASCKMDVILNQYTLTLNPSHILL
jgi:hypothetical protein